MKKMVKKMKLTFRRQEKNKKRFSVFCGEEYLFSVSEYTFVALCLRDGMETDNIEELKKECEEKEFYNYCLNILSRNSYPKKEIYSKLTKKGCSEETAEKIVEKLCRHKLLDDEEYKKRFINSAQTYKKHGRKRIKQELYYKGIEVNDEDFDREAEKENLKSIVSKMVQRNVETKKIINRMLMRGYNFYDIKEAINNFSECEDEYGYEEY